MKKSLQQLAEQYSWMAYEDFAEMIIRECVDIVQVSENSRNQILIADEIKEHFGLE